MSEPMEFPPPPFTPAPLELSERSGCRKALLFGCGGLFLILALGLVGMVVKAPEIMRAMLTYLEEDCTAKLAPNVPAADRERLHRAFEAARANPTKLMQDRPALESFQSKVIELSGKQQLSREEAAGLSAVLEKLNGTPATPVPGSAAPAPLPPRAPAAPVPDARSEPAPPGVRPPTA